VRARTGIDNMSLKRPPLEYVIDTRGDKRIRHKTTGPIRYTPCHCKQRKGFCCDNRYCVCVQRGIYCGPKCNGGQCAVGGNCTNCIPSSMLASIEQDEVITESDVKVKEASTPSKDIQRMSAEEFEKEWEQIMNSIDTDSIFKMNF